MSTDSAEATFVDPAGGLRVSSRSGSGFTMELDTDAAGGGRAGPSPMEALLSALAACTAMDVASILRKKRQAAVSYEIHVSAERSEDHPRVFTSMVVEHRLTGDLDPEAVRRSVELSATRYCPVSAMLSVSVPIQHRFRLLRRDNDQPVSGLVVSTGPR